MKLTPPSNSSHITVETDGSEDNLVHSIKPGNMAANATTAILADTAMLLCDVSKDDVDTDHFASDDEFEDNKTIVDDE